MEFTDGFDDYRNRCLPSITVSIEEFDPASNQWLLHQTIVGDLSR